MSLPEGWRETTLGEVCENISRRFDFPSKKEVVFINTGDVLAGKFLHKDYISKEGLPGQAKKAIKKGDILYSEIRPKNKRYAIVDFDVDDFVVSTKFMVLKRNDKIDLDFLYLFVTSEKILKEFNQTAESRSGTFPQITFDAVKHILINLPPLQEQKAIANILFSFDEKIELLKEQNETLEQMAQGVFKEWFVDEVDESWEDGTLGEVTNIKGGATPSTKNEDFWNGDIHWTSPKDLSNSKSVFLLDTNKKITEAGLKKISSGLLPRGTLLLFSRAPIGYLAISNVDIAINQGYIALLDDAYFSNYYMYFWLKTHMRLVEGASNGSTFQEISKSAFRQIECIVPNKENIEKFDGFVKPIFDKLLLNIEEIKTLQKTRDTLLPKLMSGEVRVS